MTRAALIASVVALGLLAPLDALAHQVGLSRGTYRLDGTTLEASVTLQNGELAAAAPDADRDHDGQLSEAEVAASGAVLLDAVTARLRVQADGRDCARGELRTARLVEGDGVELVSRHVCPAPSPRELTLDLAFVPRLSHGHRQLAVLTDGRRAADTIAFTGNTTIKLDASSPVAAVASGQPASGTSLQNAAPSPHGSLGGLFLLGIEHILTGYDHLVFLLGLVLVGGRLRSLLAVVTAFTLAHSITLALAALGIWTPSGRLIEPAIALSIAYVGVENFFVKNAEGRWRITFPFGLIHGFGFAGALAEVALPRAQLAPALFLFNLGVEAGQLAVLLVLLPILAWLRKQAWFARHGVRAVSAVIVCAGVAWFVERVVHPGG